MVSPIVTQANGLLAEFAIFPVEPERQANLVELVIQQIKSLLQNQSGFVSATVLRSRDGLRVTSYLQWSNADTYIATQPLPAFAAPDVRPYEIFAAEPSGSQLQLSLEMEGLINFGIFKMKQPANQPRFLELFGQALQMVAGQPGLISTHAHRSLYGWRCINFGHWRSLEDYAAMDANRPFSPLFSEMLDLADNEYQKTLHEVLFTT